MRAWRQRVEDFLGRKTTMADFIDVHLGKDDSEDAIAVSPHLEGALLTPDEAMALASALLVAALKLEKKA